MLDNVLYKNGSLAVIQIYHFLSLFQKLFLQVKNIYNLLDIVCQSTW